jgi:hypothetical protein
MGLHHNLPIYKVAYDLIGVAVEASRQMPRDVKRLLGEKLRDECIELSLLIYDANIAADKKTPLSTLLRRVQAVEIMLRVSRDKRYISTRHYADAVQLTDRIGKQANGWRKSQ